MSFQSFLVLFLATSASTSYVPSMALRYQSGWTTASPANIGRQELKNYQVDALTWSTTRKHIIEGRGSLIAREEDCDKKLALARQKYPGSEKAGEYVKSQLDWTNLDPDTNKNLWEEGVYNNPLFAQFRLNEFPYALPPDVTHWVYWLRVPAVSTKFFSPLRHETVPHQDFLNPVRVAALTNYINHYDFYGSSGISERVLRHLRPSSFAHPSDHVVWEDPVSRERVTRVEGAQAIKWAGRHIVKAIQSRFPPEKYEVLFNRAPERWKSVVEPDHFHVLVFPKVQDSYSVEKSWFSAENLLKAYWVFNLIP
ncbi:hypothetical protein PGT21_028371 [Puccinia graminis f. sp. tritici]|uniref:Uncharacterized protein n=1 Tax=Puccinia graminis f. sp. tritici TaxID=56615 RepID=A0A5B0PEK9_PUCGR|nr:hypothetical protein PGT21_028371 [Puccinia graminis f. sp. tritici]KAA1128126.1 hypothetical protein PGTUg99_013078 [Puccinia graminis f. sp. tritici]